MTTSDVVHRTLAVVLVVVAFLFLWSVRIVVLVGFAGVLVAVFIRGLARQLSKITPIPPRWGVGVVLLLLITATVSFWWALGPQIAVQFEQLTQRLPGTINDLRESISQTAWGGAAIEQFQLSIQSVLEGINLSTVRGMAASFAGVLSGIVAALVVGVFLTVNPGLYREGIVRLVPPRYDDRARDLLEALGDAIWKWLLGRFAAMLAVFILTTIGLWILGVPLALVLGVIAGVLDFVPWIGPLVATIPALVLAFNVSPMTAVWVAVLYLAVQQLEGNVLDPIIQHRAVSVPPALAILALAAFSLLFGLLGTLLAVPMLVVIMVFVSVLYMRGSLHEQVDVPGQ